MEEKFEKLKEIAERELKDCSAHDIEHVMRVYNLALKLAEGEDVDLDVIKAAVLLHDIGGEKERDDPTGMTDHAVESAKMAEPILRDLGFSEEKIMHICDSIITHRYKTGKLPKTKEAKILFDADKLEIVGAIGIARVFSWVGRNKGPIFKKMPVEEYVKENFLDGDINGRIKDKTKHSPQMAFETKDKHVIDKLYTEKAREIARERLKFSKQFHERLEKEINGEI